MLKWEVDPCRLLARDWAIGLEIGRNSVQSQGSDGNTCHCCPESCHYQWHSWGELAPGGYLQEGRCPHLQGLSSMPAVPPPLGVVDHSALGAALLLLHSQNGGGVGGSRGSSESWGNRVQSCCHCLGSDSEWEGLLAHHVVVPATSYITVIGS